MYFLDFDRTLFDTDAFIEHLTNRSDTANLSYESKAKFAAALNDKVMEGTLSFSPGELAQFVYADVAEFLRAMGNEATIITYGNSALQKLKIVNALAGIPRVSVFYTGETRKGEYLAPRLEFYGTSVLVDDSLLELELARKTCPSLQLFQMDRGEMSVHNTFKVITSLSELP